MEKSKKKFMANNWQEFFTGRWFFRPTLSEKHPAIKNQYQVKFSQIN